MFGGQTEERQMKGLCGTLLVGVLIGIIFSAVVIGIMSLLEGMGVNPLWSAYDADPRIGVVTRDLTQREVTNIQQAKRRYGDCPAVCDIDMSKWQPGVDRPVLSRLECDQALRSDELNKCINSHKEGMANSSASPTCIQGRDQADFVLQQFGNDGTVINPKSNPLYNPAPPKGLSKMCKK